ncbi:hypothetical protein TrST_g6876 [Triparma strigata]|uniref:CSC1/OSCA1-like cytosolic domain-containing protein n=1 Tax=Triparma strigata TaxID=1606541 RepID=A0A9W7C3C6_9STRA|nr:hypothetical protein TrST_g6876 [Triparma strigata]
MFENEDIEEALLPSATPPKPSVTVAEEFAQQKVARVFDGDGLIPLTTQVGSHLRKRDQAVITRMGQKSDPPPYMRNSSNPALSRLGSGLSEAVEEAQAKRSGHEFSRRFGVGVSLYMKMLRFLSITYVLMGVLQLPLLVSYIIGDSNVDAADETSGGFEIMSLANVPQLNETLSWGSLNQKQVFVAMTWFDCASICVFMAACIFLLQKQNQFDKDIDMIETTPADYTILVEGLPGDVDDPNEVKKYFETLLANEMGSGSVEAQNHIVAEVVVHRQCKSVLERSEEISLLQELIVAEEELVGETVSHPHFPKLKKLREQMIQLVADQNLDLVAPKHSVCAFVTFENDEGKDFACKFFKGVEKLEGTKCGCASLCARGHDASILEEVKFRGQHKLKVKRASEPEDVLYENLECTKEEVVIGRSFSMFLTFIVLILAMTVNFAIKFEVKELKPDISGCDANIDWTREMAELSEQNKECYCGLEGFSDLGFCTQIIAGTIFSYTASLLTAIVNILLASVIRKTGKWQMWKSRSSEASGSMVATFFTQFCNSAVILVLVNIDWKYYLGFDWIPNDEDVDGFSKDWYLVVGTPVFITLLANSIVPHAILYAQKLMTKFKLWKKARTAKTQLELNRISAKGRKPFNLGERFAFILVTVYITNAFSVAFPVMPWVAALTLHMMYRINKYNLLRYYVNTDQTKCFDSQMAFVTACLLPGSAVLHCFCSIVLLSDPWLEPYSIDLGGATGLIARATLPNTFPLTVLMLVFFFISACINSKKFYEALAPECLKLGVDEEDDEDNPTWTETKADFEGKDGEVLSYKIGDNPHYSSVLLGEFKHSPGKSMGNWHGAKLRLKTLRTLQIVLGEKVGEEEEDLGLGLGLEGGLEEVILGEGGDGGSLADEFHDTRSVHRPSAPSFDIIDNLESPPSPNTVLKNDEDEDEVEVEDEGSRFGRGEGEGRNSEQNMMTPEDGSLTKPGVEGQLLDTSNVSNVSSVAGLRESSMQADHHEIASIFLGEAASLLKDHHTRLSQEEGQKEKEEDVTATVPTIVEEDSSNNSNSSSNKSK